MATLDLTPFGFTPTESLVYTVLLRDGPGTGYAVARAAGLARANTYAALEGLVSKGAARSTTGKPKRFRPESPAALIAGIVDHQAQEIDRLDVALEQVLIPDSVTLVGIESTRGAVQLLAHEIARATTQVRLLIPGDFYPLLAPVLRKAISADVDLHLTATESTVLDFAQVETVSGPNPWPGEPLLAVIDDRAAMMASRVADATQGHWGAGPTFLAAVRQLIP